MPAGDKPPVAKILRGPRSSGDRARASGARCAGSNPAGGTVRLLVTFVIAGLAALVPAPAGATQHFLRIREVFPGDHEVRKAQYVELQMYFPFQTEVSGFAIDVFSAKGKKLGSFAFTEDVPNPLPQSTILIATPQAEELFGVTADLVMKPVIQSRGGMVCFSNIDCVSWGNYSGSKTKPSSSGKPFEAKKGLTHGSSIERDASGGMVPVFLDEQDDTNDSSADFSYAEPSPQGNTQPPVP